jgi:hypothetical protein
VTGNGGDVTNSSGQPGSINSDSGNGLLVFGNSRVNVQGAVTVNGGRGGNVNTGTALSLLCSVLLFDHTSIDVMSHADELAPFDCRTTDGTNWNSGGTSESVTVAVYDRSSLVAGSVRVVLGRTGNATSSDSATAKRSNSQESQRKSKLPVRTLLL